MYKEDTLDNYYTLTGVDIENLFQRCVDFKNNDAQNVINYYDGIVKEAYVPSFDKMYSLIKELKQASELFYLNRESFNSYADWNLIETISNLKSSLETISNINKYLRSSINKNQFSTGIEIDLLLKQGSTLESLERKELGSINSQNDWTSLALYNDLKEEDYTPKGGNLLKAITSNSERNFLNSVLGNLQGKNLYGIDLNRKIQFINDDFAYLSNEETILQSIDILMNLKKGDNPQFPDDGIQANLFVGNNLAGLSYSTLFRQIVNTFAKDDTIYSIRMVEIKREQDGLFISYEIQTKYGEKFTKNKII